MFHSRAHQWAAIAVVYAAGNFVRAADTADKPLLPKPAEIKSLTVYPAKVALASGDDAVQLVVTATLADGKTRDLTGVVSYSVKDGKTANVSATGRVLPRANGASEIQVVFGEKSTSVPLSAEHVGDSLPLNFTNQVVPIFTKLGCNSGGCHGKQSGQNGFRLSLLGFEPELDYTTLLKEGRGRRLFPANPDKSLLLMKATGTMPHAGGRKMEPGSDEYKLVRRWIAAGTPWGSEDDPVLAKISVFPEHRILQRHDTQQFAVYAHYSDGTTEDITRRAQFDTNQPDVAKVNDTAQINTLAISGEAAIMARYQGRVAVVRITVPHSTKAATWTFEPKTIIDTHTAKKWKDLGLDPSALCTDEQFIRRVHLDITGTMPTLPQVMEFLNDKDPAKRDKLVDRLVETPEYAFYFANKWADVLRVRRRGQGERAAGTFAFHEWIRAAVQADMPYSEFVKAILTATGDEARNPTTVWYKEMEKTENYVDDVAQVFLGQRLACANCHHHPYEKWGQDDYWGVAAFFGRVARKTVPTPSFDQNNNQRNQLVYSRPNGSVTNKRTGKPAEIKPLDGDQMTLPSTVDPRQKLVEWMVDAKNPYFARTIANRYWAHFFGRGIVDPLDDMRVTNPPSNPELLDALAKSVIDNKFSLKALVKTICKSRTYQLSSLPTDGNRDDKQSFARYYPKRLSAEVLYDAMCQLTASPASFGNLPKDRFAPARAIQLPDESFQSYFMEVFGKPQRISACECERVAEANLAQSLHLLNSEEVQQRAAAGNGRADQLAKDPRSDEQKVEELFLWALARKPTPADMKFALTHIEQVTANKGSKKNAYENLVWALLNTKEFAFNQ
jgi:hypothetical protein